MPRNPPSWRRSALRLGVAAVAAVTSGACGRAAAPSTSPDDPAATASAPVASTEAASPSFDRAALARIDAAINEFYLKGKEDAAEAELKGIYAACAERCSTAVKARAWMYVGVIWSNAGAPAERSRSAFRFALSLDPAVRLDEALASPATRQGFEAEKAAARVGASPARPTP